MIEGEQSLFRMVRRVVFLGALLVGGAQALEAQCESHLNIKDTTNSTALTNSTYVSDNATIRSDEDTTRLYVPDGYNGFGDLIINVASDTPNCGFNFRLNGQLLTMYSGLRSNTLLTITRKPLGSIPNNSIVDITVVTTTQNGPPEGDFITACTVRPTQSDISVPLAGGIVSVPVMASRTDCRWFAWNTTYPWMRMLGASTLPQSVQLVGSAAIQLEVDSTATPRSGNILVSGISGYVVRINQPGSAPPDLQVTFITDPPPFLHIGPPKFNIGPPEFPVMLSDTFTLTDTISNTGPGNQSLNVQSRTLYYLEAGTNRYPLDGSRIVPSLRAGDVSQATTTLKVPSGTPAGRYHVVACADGFDVIVEGSETNNCLSSSAQRMVTVVDFESAVQRGVTPQFSGGRADAFFRPNFGLTLPQAARLGGYDHFNWYQIVVLNSVPFGYTGIDPQLGGTLGLKARCLGQGADYFKWYMNEVLIGCAEADHFYIFKPEVTTDQSLYFVDTPNLGLLVPALARFETYLAGVRDSDDGDIIRGVDGVHFAWTFNQFSPSCWIPGSCFATIGQADFPFPNWGTASFSNYIDERDFTENRLTLLKAAGALPSDQQISQISPNEAFQGDQVQIVITGINTIFDQKASVVHVAGSGITVDAVVVNSATTITATLTIAPNALPFPRDIYIVTGTQVASGKAALAIKAAFIPVEISIKPGDPPPVRISAKSRGRIPVAILSTKGFFAPNAVDDSTLTFGSTGTELRSEACHQEDVNSDGLVDLLCNFQNSSTAFRDTSVLGVIRGKTITGVPITGQQPIIMVP